jgi:hypothetical protein
MLPRSRGYHVATVPNIVANHRCSYADLPQTDEDEVNSTSLTKCRPGGIGLS